MIHDRDAEPPIKSTGGFFKFVMDFVAVVITSRRIGAMTLQVKLSFSFSEVFSGMVLCHGFFTGVRQFTLLRQSFILSNPVVDPFRRHEKAVAAALLESDVGAYLVKTTNHPKKIQYNATDGVLSKDVDIPPPTH